MILDRIGVLAYQAADAYFARLDLVVVDFVGGLWRLAADEVAEWRRLPVAVGDGVSVSMAASHKGKARQTPFAISKS